MTMRDGKVPAENERMIHSPRIGRSATHGH